MDFDESSTSSSEADEDLPMFSHQQMFSGNRGPENGRPGSAPQHVDPHPDTSSSDEEEGDISAAPVRANAAEQVPQARAGSVGIDGEEEGDSDEFPAPAEHDDDDDSSQQEYGEEDDDPHRHRPDAAMGFRDGGSDFDDEGDEDDVDNRVEGELRGDEDDDEGLPPVEIPEWARGLVRPGTSGHVGKYSERADEFTRHMKFPEQPDATENHSDGECEGSPLSRIVPVIAPNRGVGDPDELMDTHHHAAQGGSELESHTEADEEPFPVSDAAEWQMFLEAGGSLFDESPFTQLYVVVETPEEDGDGDEPPAPPQTSIFKVMTPPLPDDEIVTDFDRAKRISTGICKSVLKAANAIAGDAYLSENVLVGVLEVHCDSQARVIVQVSPVMPSVTLADIAAFSTATSEHVRVLVTRVMAQMAELNERGLVHGALHGSNVVIRTDTGDVLLSDGCGLLSCPVLASDFSFLSPHLGAHLRDLLPSSYDLATESNSFLHDAWCAYYEDPYQEDPRDDAYAIAQLVALLIHGFPSRFGMSLPEAIADVEAHPSPQLLTMASGGAHFRQRAAAAGFTEEFLHQAQNFIDTLIGTDDILSPEVQQHPFLLTSSPGHDADAMLSQMREFIVQIATEASSNIQYARSHAGLQPMNLRLYRNSFFARQHANVLGLNSVCREEIVGESLPNGVSLWGDETIVIEGSQLQVVLYHQIPQGRTKLIIRNVSDASLIILSAFEHVMLVNVTDSSIALGPCRHVLLQNVERCTRIAVAAVRVVLLSVRDVTLALHAVDVPACPDPNTIVNLAIVPYCIAYPGLCDDFVKVGVTFECASSILNYAFSDNGSGDDGARKRAPVEIFPNWRTGHEYPYLMALASTANRIVHRGTQDDLYLFSNEAKGVKVVIEDIRGGLVSPATAALGNAPASPTRQSKHIFPVVMIVDNVEDVFISDCENCTIVIIGATGAINVTNVKNCKLLLAGAYVMLSECQQSEVYAFAVKGAMCEDCKALQVLPLVADVPNIDSVLSELFLVTGLEPVPTDNSSDMVDALMGYNIFAGPRVQQHHNTDVRMIQRPQCAYRMSADTFGVEPSVFFERGCKGWKSYNLMDLELRCSLFDGKQLGLTDPDSVLSQSNHVTVSFSNLIDASILRVAGTICPLRIGGERDVAANVLLDHIDTGVVHMADAVGVLTVANCSGPLDIVVASAQQVFVVNCNNVTVQVACFSFVASACKNCHFALHVNTEPKLERQCEAITISTLNITCANYEDLLERADVQPEINLYDRVVDVDDVVDPEQDPYALTRKSIETASFKTQSGGSSVISMPSYDHIVSSQLRSFTEACAYLARKWFPAPPLQGTCIGVAEAPFIEPLENRVIRDEKRESVDVLLATALSTVAVQSLHTADESDSPLRRDVQRPDDLSPALLQRDDAGDSSNVAAATPGSTTSSTPSPSQRQPPSGTKEDIDSEGRPSRPSARLGFTGAKRNSVEHNFDSSSDEEQESSEVQASPHRADRADLQNASSAPSLTVTVDQPAVAVFGSMGAAGHDTSSSSSDGTDGVAAGGDDDDHDTSDEDDAYVHRGAHAAQPVQHATINSTPSRDAPAVQKKTVADDFDSDSNEDDDREVQHPSPQQTTVHASVEVATDIPPSSDSPVSNGITAPSPRRLSSAVDAEPNPLREGIMDLAVLMMQQREAQKQMRNSDGDDDGEAFADEADNHDSDAAHVALLDHTSDAESSCSSASEGVPVGKPESVGAEALPQEQTEEIDGDGFVCLVTATPDQAAGEDRQPSQPQKKAKLDLGFDDDSSDEEVAPRTCAKAAPAAAAVIVDRSVAAEVMGISADVLRRSKARNIHADVSSSATTSHDVDFSEDPMLALRAARREGHPSADIGLSAPAKVASVSAANRFDDFDADSDESQHGDVAAIDEVEAEAPDGAADSIEDSPLKSADQQSPRKSQPPLTEVEQQLSPSATSSLTEVEDGRIETPPRPEAQMEQQAVAAATHGGTGVSKVVIFLDIDGVIVPVSPMCFGGGDFDAGCLKRLSEIVEACGGPQHTIVVLTSTWRLDESKKRRLNAAFESLGTIPAAHLGVPNGVPTPTSLESLGYLTYDPDEQRLVCARVDEIMEFLSQSAAFLPDASVHGRWIAIDDMDLGVDPRMTGHFVKTDTEEGITTADVVKARRLILDLPTPPPCAADTNMMAVKDDDSRGKSMSSISGSSLLDSAAIQAESAASALGSLHLPLDACKSFDDDTTLTSSATLEAEAPPPLRLSTGVMHSEEQKKDYLLVTDTIMSKILLSSEPETSLPLAQVPVTHQGVLREWQRVKVLRQRRAEVARSIGEVKSRVDAVVQRLSRR